ncbi:hypothetical protein EG329_007119 [Mollisiaceae sp. DMI_Dod_QoI]|nr:hypothetical protein EG329_007119 [Helotiales sp. DMI_Dod_QoI]
MLSRLNLRSGPPAPDSKSQFDPSSALRRLDAAYLADRFLFTKEFEISVRTNNDALLSTHLLCMTNIVSFSADFANTDAPHTCSALSDLPSRTFRDLELHVAGDTSLDAYGNYWWGGLSSREISPNRFKWPDLSHFQNLRSLKLFGLDGFMSRLAHDIAIILVASPQLKVLGVGMHLNSFLKNYRLRHITIETDKKLLIRDIIDEMQKLRPDNNPQLNLEELILGLGALPGTPLKVDETIQDLSPLTKLENLQVLQLVNGDTAGFEDQDILDIEPQAFYSCTKLRRLVVDVLSDDIVDLIETLRSTSVNLVELEVSREQNPSRTSLIRLPNQLAKIGSHWKKMHLEFSSAMQDLFGSQIYHGAYLNLEELSLAVTATVKDSKVWFDVREPWNLIFTQMPHLPRLHYLLLNFNQTVHPFVASHLVTSLFTTHEDTMHAQNLPSDFMTATFKSPGQEVTTFERIFVPAGVEEEGSKVETGRDWKLVETVGKGNEGVVWGEFFRILSEAPFEFLLQSREGRERQMD